MRVVITGGTGQIGRAVSATLSAEGHEVVVLSRNPDGKAGVGRPAGVRLVRWDARTANGWAEWADGADAIVNLAGANISGDHFFPTRWTPQRKQVIRDSRVNAGLAVVDAIERAKVKPRVVIQASAIGVYGARGDEIVTEEDAPGKDFLAQLTIADWEPSTAPVEQMGVRRAIIRNGIVLSPSDGALYRLLLPFRLFVGGKMGSGRQFLHWIHPADHVAGIRFLIDNQEASGLFNLTSPNPVTNAEFSRALGRVLRRPSWLPLPGFALKLAFGEVSSVLLEGQRAVPHRLQELGFVFRFPNVEGALRDLLK